LQKFLLLFSKRSACLLLGPPDDAALMSRVGAKGFGAFCQKGMACFALIRMEILQTPMIQATISDLYPLLRIYHAI